MTAKRRRIMTAVNEPIPVKQTTQITKIYIPHFCGMYIFVYRKSRFSNGALSCQAVPLDCFYSIIYALHNGMSDDRLLQSIILSPVPSAISISDDTVILPPEKSFVTFPLKILC